MDYEECPGSKPPFSAGVGGGEWLKPPPTPSRTRNDILEETAAYIERIWVHRIALIKDLEEKVRRYVQKQGPEPEELQLYLHCKEFSTLPVSGGLFDQPDWLYESMIIAGSIYTEEMTAQAAIEASRSKFTSSVASLAPTIR